MIDEKIIMKIILHSGNARSKAFEALDMAEHAKYEEALTLLAECEKELSIAHTTQTGLIQDEVNGKGVSLNLLLVHAQDHLMNAITVKELVGKMIQMYKRLKED